ncbi:MAG: TonB-dependent receptor [Lysobacterales bacterium]
MSSVTSRRGRHPLSAALSVLLLPAAAWAAPAAPSDDPALLDVIKVDAQRQPGKDIVSPTEAPASLVDAAALAARAPGAALIDNGAISGQVQYRGVFGPRVNVRIDGQGFESGGPNLMDPPLHYAPMGLIERLEIDRGIAPVSAGPGLGGGVNAVLKQSRFGADDSWQSTGELAAGGRSANDSYGLSGFAALSNDRVRLHAFALRERGDDIEFPGGTIRSSDHERDVWGFGSGVQTGDHEFRFSARRQDTGPTGNPPFAMDIRYFHTDFWSAGWTHHGERSMLFADVGYTDVEHAMNNFRARPITDPTRFRETYADARTLTGRLGWRQAQGADALEFGLDLRTARKDVRITNPNNASFFVDSLPDIAEERVGAYVEWQRPLGEWRSELGLRVDRSTADAGEAAVGTALPMGPRNLAAAFNARDRDLSYTTTDLVARFWLPGPQHTWRLSLARKSRVGGYVERFAWLPTEASGGLADGNTYVGDLGLEPEVAWIAEAGVDLQLGAGWARPTLWYRRIDDYIQGVPFDDTPGVIDTPVEMVSSMNGDPTPLRFANVDAQIHGVDVDFGYRFSKRWQLDGVASWVKGRRRDIDDDLYRLSPPSLRLGLSWLGEDWRWTLESQHYAEQDEVSQTNSELPSAGYSLFGLRADWILSPALQLQFGVENLTDHEYRPHLAGSNRVSGSDVALGERLPGAGRDAYLRVNWQW